MGGSDSKQSPGPSNLPMERRIIENVHLIWLDANLDESTNDFHNSITNLRRIVNTVSTFTVADECVDFLSKIKDKKVLMIVSGGLGQHIVPYIHDMSQLNTIFVFCSNETWHKQWAKKWSKVKDVYTEIDPICKALKEVTRPCNTISISFVTAGEASNKNMDQLDQSFMYTQILKGIVLKTYFDEQSFTTLTTYCCGLFADDDQELNNIKKFEREYRQKSPVWWYTYECFLYPMLNRALRALEVDTIVKMGFFIQDLQRQIEKLHSKQFDSKHMPFTVYRGEGLSREDFEKLMQTKGGLMSFNNFLCTSQRRDIALDFATRSLANSGQMGVLLTMTIDPLVSTAPFAHIDGISYHENEEEILFSMHTVFRIGEVRALDQSDRLWQVDLKLTSDNDPLLNALIEQMREDTQGESEGWKQLGQLLIKRGEFDKAKEVFQILLEQTTLNENDKADYYHQLGCAKDNQGDHLAAIWFYEKALEIKQKTLPVNHPDLVPSYNNIGSVYDNIGEYSKALLFYKKALEVRQKTLPANHLDLALSYNNIGIVYDKLTDYSKALMFYERALEIYQKTLPTNHPNLASSYNNIGVVYDKLNDYSKALLFYEKALEIREKILPANHSSLGPLYHNIGLLYMNISEYSKALVFYEKALGIHQKTLPTNHPDLAFSYSNIGLVYNNIGDYSKALSSHEKALEIRQKTLPTNHPDLATLCSNIGSVYNNMDEYGKALSFYEQALEIYQNTPPEDHSVLANFYNNIGLVYSKIGKYAKALSSHEKALEIKQKTLPANHPDLAAFHNNIGGVYDNMDEYGKAFFSYKKALEIRQKTLPPNHPDLAISNNNIGEVYYNMKEYSNALPLFERALEIGQHSLPDNHPVLQRTREWLEDVREKLRLEEHT